jgi:DNA primase
MIPDSSTIAEVKAYPGIVEVIGDWVELKKRGRNYLGLCPFHSEKTPSFTVSPDKQIWHCFGCQKSGDLISFVQEIDNLSFYEAIVHIAKRAGINIKEQTSSKKHNPDQKIDHLLEILFLAREFYKKNLQENQAALKYLQKRQINEQSCLDFHLGFAPPHQQLIDHLLSKNFSYELLRQAGLVYTNDQGQHISRFKDRLIFPILDYRGRTVGFGARTISEISNIPKYINTAETIFFNKRKLLYGLNQAKKHISKSKNIILMEGYLDVILAHQHGFRHAVATMGTALTNEHAQKIKMHTNHIFLALDNDNAGQNAIQKSYEVLKNHHFKINVCRFEHKDPADTLSLQGAASFSNSLAQATSYFDYFLNQQLMPPANISIENIPDIIEKILPIIKQEADPIVKQHYINQLASKLNINEQLIVAKLLKTSYNIRKSLFFSHKKNKDKYLKAQEYLLYQIATDLEAKNKILNTIKAEDFIQTDYIAIAKAINETDKTNKDILTELENSKLKNLLAKIIIEGENKKLDKNKNIFLNDCLNTLRTYQLERKKIALLTEIKELEKLGKDEEASIVTKKYSDLIKEISVNI